MEFYFEINCNTVFTVAHDVLIHTHQSLRPWILMILRFLAGLKLCVVIINVCVCIYIYTYM